MNGATAISERQTPTEQSTSTSANASQPLNTPTAKPEDILTMSFDDFANLLIRDGENGSGLAFLAEIHLRPFQEIETEIHPNVTTCVMCGAMHTLERCWHFIAVLRRFEHATKFGFRWIPTVLDTPPRCVATKDISSWIPLRDDLYSNDAFKSFKPARLNER